MKASRSANIVLVVALIAGLFSVSGVAQDPK